MKTPYKMKGNPMQRNFGLSPVKNDKSSAELMNMNDAEVRAQYLKYKDNPEYRKAIDKKMGGKFSYNEETNTSTVSKDQPEEGGYTDYAKELDKETKKGSAATKKKKKAAPVKNYKNGYYGA
jgi:hypothetical protein